MPKLTVPSTIVIFAGTETSVAMTLVYWVELVLFASARSVYSMAVRVTRRELTSV